MKIRRKKVGVVKEQAVAKTEGNLDEEIYDDIALSQRMEVYRKHFKQLGPDCQKVLNLFLNKTSLRQIADMMNFSEQYAKKKKYVCQKQLIASIETDPLYNELVNH